MIKVLTFVLLVALDFFSKFFIKNNLNLNQIFEINQFIDIVYVQNFGVSFGLLSGILSHWLLIIIGLIVVVIIVYLMLISEKNIEKIAYFMVIIGAISNILDRTINTYVVDFILVHYGQFYWPAFNLADIYITIGIIMLIISFFIKPEESE